jgi:hypothetical protein
MNDPVVEIRMLGRVAHLPPKARTEAGLVPVLRDYLPKLEDHHALLVVKESDSARVSRALTILMREPELHDRHFSVRRVLEGVMVWRDQ